MITESPASNAGLFYLHHIAHCLYLHCNNNQKLLMKQLFTYTEGGGNAAISAAAQTYTAVDFIILDLFCGAGGTTTGFDMATIGGKKCAIIAACINHDFKAIKSHWLNHPEVEHYEEDITTMYGAVKTYKVFNWKTCTDDDYNIFFKSPEMLRLERLINLYRAFYPNAKFILWASLECTNFSKAKGGLPRDADSRTLANHLDRYIHALDPDYIQIENVVEFMSWGPLDYKGKPISKKNGADWLRWCNHIRGFGYYDQWKELNSADFGAYTSRNRLFGCFAKHGLPIVWPEPTHAKKPKINNVKQQSLFVSNTGLQAWKAVKEVLDFADEGNSIFNRKKPLSVKTLERIYAGLIKYVAGGKDKFMQQIYACTSINSGSNYSIDQPARTVTTRDATAIIQTSSFLSTYNSGDPENRNISLERPCRTLLTANTYSLIVSNFIVQRNAGVPEGRIVSLDGPARTLTATAGNQDLVSTCFISKYYSGNPEGKVIPVTGPAGTIRTSDGQSLVQCFLANYYGAPGQTTDIQGPAGTITTKARTAKIWLDKSYSGSQNHQSIDVPAGTLLQKDKFATIRASWIDRNFSSGTKDNDINGPAGSILSVPKLNLVQPFVMNTNYTRVGTSINEPTGPLLASRRHYYIVSPSHKGYSRSIDLPCPVIIARQDKSPLYLLYVEAGDIKVSIPVYDDEPEIMVKIKEFMWLYKISDIKMRMLKVPELLKIQGFPEEYHLFGNQSDQKKFIGNSVHPLVPKFWAQTLAGKLRMPEYMN